VERSDSVRGGVRCVDWGIALERRLPFAGSMLLVIRSSDYMSRLRAI
jgi:hypothetical protein